MDPFSRANATLYDAFLRELERQDASADEALSTLCAALPACTAMPSLRTRVLMGARFEGRLARFAAPVAHFLDVSVPEAESLLDRALLPDAFTEPLPGIGFLWVSGGARVADAMRGFVRVRAGVRFPEHEHLGEEALLVLQGTLLDRTRGLRLGPGELDVLPAGSAHDFQVPADGPDLLGLTVTHVGVRVLGVTLRGGSAAPF